MAGAGTISQRHQSKPQQSTPKAVTQQPVDLPAVTTPPIAEDRTPAGKRVEPYRHCPLCWERCKGYGTAYRTDGSTRYYRCSQTLTEHPPCGWTWSAKVTLHSVTIEYKTVNVQTRKAD